MKPSILVLIPTFNRVDSLIKNLDNFIRIASCENRITIKILVGDNCSTDNTASCLSEYAKRYGWIKFYVNDSNLGITKNIVRGVSDCNEDYLWILGDDDYVSLEIFDEIASSIVDSREMICLWEKRFFDMDAAINFISKESPYKKIERKCFNQLSLKWRRKVAIKSGFISSYIFKRDLYQDGFFKFRNKISFENNYFLRACILNAIGKSRSVVLIIPGIAVMRKKGSESHFVANESFKTFLFDDLEVLVHIISEKLLTGLSLWFYVYDFFRTRTGLLEQYGLKRYSEVVSNLDLKKNDLLILRIIFSIYRIKFHNSL